MALFLVKVADDFHYSKASMTTIADIASISDLTMYYTGSLPAIVS